MTDPITPPTGVFTQLSKTEAYIIEKRYRSRTGKLYRLLSLQEPWKAEMVVSRVTTISDARKEDQPGSVVTLAGLPSPFWSLGKPDKSHHPAFLEADINLTYGSRAVVRGERTSGGIRHPAIYN